MTKHYIRIFIIVATCLTCGLRAKADDNSKAGVWVAVSLFDGLRNSASEYYGLMPKDQYEGITQSTMTNGFFKLSNTVWMEPEGLMLMSDIKSSGRSRGYSGEVHFLVRAITRIIILDPEYIKNTVLPALKQSE